MMQLCPFIFRSKPAIPELDFSGTLVAAGSGALESGRLAIGDSVFGSIGVESHVKAGSGALTEFVVVPVANVAKSNSDATDAEVAGLGVAGCAAVALMEKAELKIGNSVLVNGASGGIGSMVVQMARDAVGTSGRVVAVCSGTNTEMVKELGADEVRQLYFHWVLLDSNAGHRLSTTRHVIPSQRTSRHIFPTSVSTRSLTLMASESSILIAVTT